MKIVHCFWAFPIGGSESMLVDIMNRQVLEHDVTLVIMNDNISPILISKLSPKVKIIRINRPLGSKNPYYVIKFNWVVRRLKADIAHLHQHSLPKYVLMRPARGFIFTYHDITCNLTYARKADKIISISEAVKEDILSHHNMESIVIKNGIETDNIVQREKIMPGKPFRIVEVARLVTQKKGQDLLISAVARLRKRGIDVTVDFIGEGESEAELKQLAKDLGVSNYVNFLGVKSRDYVYSHLAEYDLMCHPARFEGFGLVVAEAMAARLPVLVSNDGGPLEIIEGGRYGFAFKNGDIDDCAVQIENIINNYNKALAIVDDALAHVRENYSVEKQTRQYLEVYASLLNNGKL